MPERRMAQQQHAPRRINLRACEQWSSRASKSCRRRRRALGRYEYSSSSSHGTRVKVLRGRPKKGIAMCVAPGPGGGRSAYLRNRRAAVPPAPWTQCAGSGCLVLQVGGLAEINPDGAAMGADSLCNHRKSHTDGARGLCTLLPHGAPRPRGLLRRRAGRGRRHCRDRWCHRPTSQIAHNVDALHRDGAAGDFTQQNRPPARAGL